MTTRSDYAPPKKPRKSAAETPEIPLPSVPRKLADCFLAKSMAVE